MAGGAGAFNLHAHDGVVGDVVDALFRARADGGIGGAVFDGDAGVAVGQGDVEFSGEGEADQVGVDGGFIHAGSVELDADVVARDEVAGGGEAVEADLGKLGAGTYVDALFLVWQHGEPVDVGADDVACDEVSVGVVSRQLDAVPVIARDDVAVFAGGVADGVVPRAVGNKDAAAAQVAVDDADAFGRELSLEVFIGAFAFQGLARGRLGIGPHAAQEDTAPAVSDGDRAGFVGADKVACDVIEVGERASQADAVVAIARDDVAGVAADAAFRDAVFEEDAVVQVAEALDAIGADAAVENLRADDDTAGMNAGALEADDGQAFDNDGIGGDRQPIAVSGEGAGKHDRLRVSLGDRRTCDGHRVRDGGERGQGGDGVVAGGQFKGDEIEHAVGIGLGNRIAQGAGSIVRAGVHDEVNCVGRERKEYCKKKNSPDHHRTPDWQKALDAHSRWGCGGVQWGSFGWLGGLNHGIHGPHGMGRRRKRKRKRKRRKRKRKRRRRRPCGRKSGWVRRPCHSGGAGETATTGSDDGFVWTLFYLVR